MKKRLILAATLDTLGTAITWTGLPVFAFNLTGSYLFAGSLYLTGSVSRILMTIFGGSIIDQFSKKKITMISLLLNALIMIGIYTGILSEQFYFLFPLMILSQCLGSISNISQDVWFNSVVDPEVLARTMSARNSFVLTSKTIGFTAGPMIFVWMGAHALLLDAFSFLICLMILWGVTYGDQVQSVPTSVSKSLTQGLKASFVEVFKSPPLRSFSSVLALDGVITPTVISLSIYVLHERYHAPDEALSIFWFAGGVGAVAANMILARMKVLEWSKVRMVLISLLMTAGGLLIMLLATHWGGYIGGFLMLTLGNPLMNNLSRSEIFLHAKPEMKGKMTGITGSFMDLGTLTAISVTGIILDDVNIEGFLSVMIGFSLIRNFMFYRSLSFRFTKGPLSVHDSSSLSSR